MNQHHFSYVLEGVTRTAVIEFHSFSQEFRIQLFYGSVPFPGITSTVASPRQVHRFLVEQGASPPDSLIDALEHEHRIHQLVGSTPTRRQVHFHPV